nr:hypothetical protein [Tanacetum cinerariifolium]
MACSVSHTDDEIQVLVQKQIDEDMVRQKSIMNLALQFDNACTAKDDLRKAYEKCNNIPQESRALIDTFLKEASVFKFKIPPTMDNKTNQSNPLTPEKPPMPLIYSYPTVEESAEEHDIGDEYFTEGYLTEKGQQQLALQDEALREMLEEEARVEKERARAEKELEEEMKKEQAHDELFRLEFGVISIQNTNQIKTFPCCIFKFLDGRPRLDESPVQCCQIRIFDSYVNGCRKADERAQYNTNFTHSMCENERTAAVKSEFSADMSMDVGNRMNTQYNTIFTHTVSENEANCAVNGTSEFATNMVFKSHEDMTDWVKTKGRSLGYAIIIRRSRKEENGFISEVVLMCNHGGIDKSKNLITEKNSKKINCPFQLVGKYSLWECGWTLQRNVDHTAPFATDNWVQGFDP